ncbi:MAG: response regulator [Dehalococcoidales bacterium]|nr:response regulator [Dehalococcoidales bacterium]
MAKATGDLASADFAEVVRDALLHLYDTTYLRTHRLSRLLARRADGTAGLEGKELFQVLLQAVEALRPPPGTRTDSPAWRKYRLLELRYLDALSAQSVMRELAVSKTQYHRDHGMALAAVAATLQERYQASLDNDAATGQAVPEGANALAEAEQVALHSAPEFLDASSTVAELLALFRPVCAENHTTLTVSIKRHLPRIHVDRSTFRQVVLGLLNSALERCDGGTLKVGVARQGPAVELSLAASGGQNADGSHPTEAAGHTEIEVIRHLVGIAGGTLRVSPPSAGDCWSAEVTFPAARRPLVLVVDNHPDFLGLIARYLGESNWDVLGATNVAEARGLVLECKPNVILLDVMMPREDGWDLLMALKQQRGTKDIPVIICSVLREPQVARALGAADYLPKPISQEALAAALARWQPPAAGPAESPRQRR